MRSGARLRPSARGKGIPARYRDSLGEPALGLRRLGYPPVDAAFLAAAALLGGYFVRRQFRSFAGCRRGGRESSILRRALANGHAVPAVGKTLYRLRGSELYRALGPWGHRGLLRSRARRSVKQRLLALDYFIEHAEGLWLLHETAKEGHFSTLGIDRALLPQAPRARSGNSRVFPDGFPIGLVGEEPARAVFSYAHAGSSSAGMSRTLDRHEALVGALADRGIETQWTVLADSPLQFLRLRLAWRKWVRRVERDFAEGEYFELRHAVDRHVWKALSGPSVERYAELLASLPDSGTEHRYRSWVEGGAHTRVRAFCIAPLCSYREILLDHDYSIADRVVAS